MRSKKNNLEKYHFSRFLEEPLVSMALLAFALITLFLALGEFTNATNY